MTNRSARSFGQDHLKNGFPGFGLNLDDAPMLSHHPHAGVEPQAGSFTDAFGREKRIEDVGEHVSRNPGTVVLNFDHNFAPALPGSDTQFPAVRHGLDRVDDQIRPDLVQLHSVGADFGDLAVVFADYSDRFLADLMRQDGQRALDSGMNIDLLFRSLVHVSVLLDRVNQLRKSGSRCAESPAPAGPLRSNS